MRAPSLPRSRMETTPHLETAAFTGLIDLAAERVGGKALVASDEFFAAKENLLKASRGVFIPERYTDQGKWMDGWETRRKREPGHDWCIVKLGLPGIILGVDIDTNHFLGNHPSYASIEALAAEDRPSAEELSAGAAWTEILCRSPLRPGSQNLFSVTSSNRWTHVKLHIYPDGGVARLRVYGRVLPDWSRIKAGEIVDLAAVENGGLVVATSGTLFGATQ